jgi:hypothetical protein
LIEEMRLYAHGQRSEWAQEEIRGQRRTETAVIGKTPAMKPPPT